MGSDQSASQLGQSAGRLGQSAGQPQSNGQFSNAKPLELSSDLLNRYFGDAKIVSVVKLNGQITKNYPKTIETFLNYIPHSPNFHNFLSKTPNDIWVVRMRHVNCSLYHLAYDLAKRDLCYVFKVILDSNGIVHFNPVQLESPFCPNVVFVFCAPRDQIEQKMNDFNYVATKLKNFEIAVTRLIKEGHGMGLRLIDFEISYGDDFLYLFGHDYTAKENSPIGFAKINIELKNTKPVAKKAYSRLCQLIGEYKIRWMKCGNGFSFVTNYETADFIQRIKGN